ncbi:MAG: aminoacyl-tRNA hydrolase [Gammaproteobacteria bacterium]
MTATQPPTAIVGLGNPGSEYKKTRHNAGYWFVDRLASECGETLRPEAKFLGDAGQISLAGCSVRLLKPTSFMNESGQSVRRFIDFYKLDPERILVIHDELDLPPGTVRLKYGGGHGGHNGLRDVVAHCGRDFLRLRIGIGHPGDKRLVTNYVLRQAPKAEHELIVDSLMEAGKGLDVLMQDGLDRAQTYLHTATPP